jgi:glutathione S-transferase
MKEDLSEHFKNPERFYCDKENYDIADVYLWVWTLQTHRQTYNNGFQKTDL